MLGTVMVLSAAGIAIGLSIHWFPTDASKQPHNIATLYDVLIVASVPIFVLVTSVVIYSVVFFRMRPGQEDEDGPPLHGNTRLEVIWTAIPAMLLVGLCVYAYVVLREIEKKPTAANAATREMKVRVDGEQFTWTFTYPKDVAGGKPLTTNQLYVPIGRSVDFRIHAKDVIHDFWVPAFRLKMDAVPGIETHYRVTPKRLGTYPVVCAELCGLGHGTMRSSVQVVTAKNFKRFLTLQTKPAAPAGAPAHPGAPHDERPIWRRPNLLRAILFFFGGAAFAYVLVGVIRTAMHESHPWHTWNAFLQVGLIAGPMFFLVGLGAFDYWFYWAAGRPTRPEDHSGHGAYSWRDYFRINTDHKVIGIQYTVHSFVFLLIGGMLDRKSTRLNSSHLGISYAV